MTTKNQPHRSCYFAVGQLVTCAGPFNSGQDNKGYWRQVEEVVAIRWDEVTRSSRRPNRKDAFWRVLVPGYSGRDIDYSPAPEGSQVGDIIRIGSFGG